MHIFEFGALVLAIGALFANPAGAVERLTAANVAGTYEATVVFPSADYLKVRAHVTRFQIAGDGTLIYTEYHDHARTVGLLDTAHVPSCPGTYALDGSTLKIVTDCSRYTGVATTELDVNQIDLATLRTHGQVLTLHSSLAPIVQVRALVRKVDDVIPAKFRGIAGPPTASADR